MIQTNFSSYTLRCDGLKCRAVAEIVGGGFSAEGWHELSRGRVLCPRCLVKLIGSRFGEFRLKAPAPLAAAIGGQS